ncbi:hypothetical protein C8R42DRAFT_466209 [Lentinula raphanica]|nr:hypothetical protein C8R42DRAFT_466209 [Lentinula raphanica]
MYYNTFLVVLAQFWRAVVDCRLLSSAVVDCRLLSSAVIHRSSIRSGSNDLKQTMNSGLHLQLSRLISLGYYSSVLNRNASDTRQ